MLPAHVLFDFLRKDFKRAWDAMALTDFDPDVGGNFMFARQAMVLLELASRVATADGRLSAFSAEIERTDPLYFTCLSGRMNWPKGFDLPSSPTRGDRYSQLLPILFDLVRHGQLHYGEQLVVELAQGGRFGVSLGGVTPGRTLDRLRREPGPVIERPLEHLAFRKRETGHFELWVSPGRLFVDLEDAAGRAGVFTSETSFRGWTRRWQSTAQEFEESIRSSGAFIWEEQSVA